MTVGELIEELKKLPPDVRVLTTGYEGGYDDVDIGGVSTYAANVEKAWYYGDHDQVDDWNKYEDKEHFQAVVIA